jgi:transposase
MTATLSGDARCCRGKVQKQITTSDAHSATLIAQDQTLSAKAQKLTAIKGVGARTAALLLAQMPELGTLNRGQAAPLGGFGSF